MRLVLLDIDCTLLTCGTQVIPFFALALREVFGVTGAVDGYDFAGRTDPGIAIDLMTAAGVPRDEVVAGLPRLRDRYLAELDARLDAAQMRLLPGVRPLLERLAARDDVVLGLLTGNWEPAAHIKLGRLGVDGFFPFGAYGCDSVDRNELPPVALARAEKWSGRSFQPREALNVGDSRHDVCCARAHGIPSLAVATGRTPAAALREAGADWVVPEADLAAVGGALAAEVLATGSSESIARTKRLLLDALGRPLDDALDRAARVNAEARTTDDCKRGIATFLETKKPPVWR